MKYLVTFRSEFRGCITHGMMVADDPIEWLAEIQDEPGTFVLLNAQPMTDKQAKEYDGEFKGM
jgi:hypothetical protein